MTGFNKNGTTRKIKPWWTFDPMSFSLSVSESSVRGLQHQALEHGFQLHHSEGRAVLFGSSSAPKVVQGFIKVTGGTLIRSGYHLNCFLKGASPTPYALFENGSDVQWVAWPRGLVEINSYNNLVLGYTIYTTDSKAFGRCRGVLQEHLHIKPRRGQVLILHQSSPAEPITTRQLGIVRVPLIRENYNPKVLEGYGQMIADLKRHEPTGRLSIITGVPGTGKTYLLRALVTEIDCVFLLVPPRFIPRLGDPEFINCLLNVRSDTERPLVLLLEDADAILSSRSSTNMDGIMSALNLGDGLMGDLLDARLIATSNVMIDDVDPALTRPGRLSVRIDVGPLEPEQANKALLNLVPGTGVRLSKAMTLAEVYKKARQEGWEPPPRKQPDRDVAVPPDIELVDCVELECN